MIIELWALTRECGIAALLALTPTPTQTPYCLCPRSHKLTVGGRGLVTQFSMKVVDPHIRGVRNDDRRVAGERDQRETAWDLDDPAAARPMILSRELHRSETTASQSLPSRYASQTGAGLPLLLLVGCEADAAA